MNAPGGSDLTTHELLEIERVCDHFESELRDHRNSDIESHVAGLPLRLQERVRNELGELLKEFGRNAPDTRLPTVSTTAAMSGAAQLRDGNVPLLVRGNRFEIHQRLGVGGAGCVWRAYDRHLGRWVALKVPHENSIVDAGRFLREARTVARLQHPRIVRVLDAGQDEMGCFMVSELVDGVSLGDKLKQTNYSPRDAALLMVQIADGLSYAHKAGIVHRDLKPQNILIDEKGDPYITDFGLAKDWFQNSEQLTQAGQIVGTPAYMAPEQAGGEPEKAEPRTDIFAMGVMLYQMFTGELPFRGDVESTLYQVTNRDPVAPRTLNPNLAVELDVLCMKCLEKVPSQRIASAESLRQELTRFLNHQPIQSRPLGPYGRLKKLVRRNPGLTALGLVASLLVLLVVSISLASAIVVAQGWSREFRLRVDAEVANHAAEVAVANEKIAHQQAVEAQLLAEQNTKRAQEEALLSQQSLQFLEGIIQASDPVTWVLGARVTAKEDVPKLTELLDSAAQRIKTELSNQPRVQSRLLDTIANSYRGLGRYADAIQLLEQSALIRSAASSQTGPSFDAEAVRNRFYRGMVHQDLTEFAKAERIYREILESPSRAQLDAFMESDVEFQLGWLLNSQVKGQEAQSHFQRALDIRTAIYPKGANAIKAARVGLEICQAPNMGELSIEQLQSVIQGDDRMSRIASLYLTMLANRKFGNYDAASAMYAKVLEQLQEQLGPEHPLCVLAMGEYADLLWRMGDFRNALPLIERAIAVAEKLAPDHIKLRRAREVYGTELMRALRFKEADVQLKKVVEFDVPPTKISSVAHEGLVWTCLIAKQYNQALEHAQLLADRSKEVGPDYKTAWYQFALARAHEKNSNIEATGLADQEALRIVKSLAILPDQAMWLQRTATIFAHAGDLTAAENLHRSALERDRATNPSDHPYIADRMVVLSGVLRKTGKDAEALELLRDALRIQEKNLPAGDLRIEQTRERIKSIETK